MATKTSSPNVSTHTHTQAGQAKSNGRKSKHRGSRKRSTSSPFASLFATLTSFSSSSTSAAVAPAIRSTSSVSRTSNSLPSSSNGPKSKAVTTAQNDRLNKGMPSPKDVSSRALVRRATTPATQVAASSKPSPKTTVSAKPTRPNVFSFQNGESRPPSPRPRNTSSTTKSTSRPIRHSVDQERVYSSPIPVRPVTLPSPGTSLEDSYSDSGLTTSETPSPPDTPSPSERRALAPLQAGSSSQDAVGRSIHPEDFYKGKRRGQQLQQINVPPEAPTAPHIQQPQPTSPSTQTFGVPSFDHLSSPSLQGSYNPANIPYPMPSGIYGTAAAPSSVPLPRPNPYPTPPLETLSHRQRRPAYSSGPQQDQSRQSLGLAPTRKPLGQGQLASSGVDHEYCPRQYAHLTQQMIRRCESIINTLEDDLARLDGSTTGHDGTPGCWHRDQLIMKLSNVIIMHHRLLDTWTKISPLPKLVSLPSTPATAAKLESIQADIRRNFDTYKNLQGFDMDSTIAHIVNDLVQIGDEAVGGRGHNGGDRQSLAYLFGAILVLLLLQDGFGMKSVLAGALILGLWRCAMG